MKNDTPVWGRILYLKAAPRSTLMLLLLLVLTTTRFWRLPDVPPGFWYDEAFNAMDALRLLDGQLGTVFVPGNGGRGTMFHHLAGLYTVLFGVSPFSFRLVAAMFSLLSIALMYRWLLTLWTETPNRNWLALIGAAGLGFSFWYLVLSRTGYRGALIPFFFLVITYFFWRGWRQQKLWPFITAGLVLGLSQYVYQPARLFPLVFGGFVILWSLQQHFWRPWPESQPGLGLAWRGLIAMALASVITFLPLGLYFLENPGALFGHTSSISVVSLVAAGETTYLRHWLEALTVFTTGSAMHWQRNIVGVPGFDLLSQLGFWLGTLIAIKEIRRPAHLFLLVSLVITWLPGPLGVPAVDSLHVSGMYPSYYALMALGLWRGTHWSLQKMPRLQPAWAGIIALGAACLISGGISLHKYFARWAPLPETYYAYEGPVADLVNHLKETATQAEVLIPLDLYTFPTSRVLLYGDFPEATTPPQISGRPWVLVTGPDGDLPEPPTQFLWLHHDGQQGQTYSLAAWQIRELLANTAIDASETFDDPFTNEPIARLSTLQPATPPTAALPGQAPLAGSDDVFDAQANLRGWRLEPRWLSPNTEPPRLTLYWQLLSDQPARQSIFLHVLDPAGNMVAQFDRDFTQDWERWRRGHLLITEHALVLPPDLPPGPYIIRAGLFDPFTGERVPVLNNDGSIRNDYVRLGLFYQGEEGPRSPDNLLATELGQAIQLHGYDVQENELDLTITLHWQSLSAIEVDYTIFLQLLDAQNNLIAGADTQPLGGAYPTSRWRQGDVIITPITLPLPPDLPPGRYRLVTGMYNLNTGERLSAVDAGGQTWPNQAIELQDWTR